MSCASRPHRTRYGPGRLALRGKAYCAFSMIVLFGPWQSVQQARASEPPPATGLDAYLGQLGYDGVSFKKNERKQPLIDIEIGSRQHVMLVDTGCRTTTLTPAAAAGLKTLGQLGVALDDRVLGRITNAGVALVDKLVIGRGQFLNQPALVQPLDMDYIRLPFDGILGLDFFFRNFCLIDCYRRELFLHAGRPTQAQRAAMEESLQRSGFIEVPLEARRYLTVNAAVNNEPVRLLVDTGDSVSVLDQSLAKRLKLSSIKWEDPARGSLLREDVSGNLIGFGRIGSHKVWVATLSSLQIGGKSWTNVPYGVVNLNDWDLSKSGGPGNDVQGFFGNDWLHQHGAVIDFCNLKLWFRPEKKHD